MLSDTIYRDLYRFNGKRGFFSLIETALRKAEFRYVLYFRWHQGGRMQWLARIALHIMCRKTLSEIGRKATIGSGFVIMHLGNIGINNGSVLGNDCTVYKGATIGVDLRGKRQGFPTLGNRVWVGTYAMIFGNITIGDDVLIAPGAYVNFDVPSHSIVLGNPGRIIPRDNATEGYITRTE